MRRPSSGRHVNLRLVKSGAPSALILTDPTARAEFESLTERLVDLAIEILDVADGDPDRESNGDEFEPNGDEFDEDIVSVEI